MTNLTELMGEIPNMQERALKNEKLISGIFKMCKAICQKLEIDIQEDEEKKEEEKEEEKTEIAD